MFKNGLANVANKRTGVYRKGISNNKRDVFINTGLQQRTNGKG